MILASGIAHGQSTGSLDIFIPTSFPLAATKAYDSSYNTVDVWGPVDVFKYGSGIYVTIPTNAPEGEKLTFFQDTGTWTLFRNNTLVLPVHSNGGQVANFVLAIGDMSCEGGRFYGQVTGMELDTKALSSGDASAGAVFYLDKLPDRASYRVSLPDDDGVKKAIMNEASKNGQTGIIKLMVEVSGSSSDAQSSIGYTIFRMKADEPEPDGNITAYKYSNGAVSRLPCKTIRSAEGPVYETISSGLGTFAFVGPFREPQPIKAGLENVLIFAGLLATLLMALVMVTVKVLRQLVKK